MVEAEAAVMGEVEPAEVEPAAVTAAGLEEAELVVAARPVAVADLRTTVALSLIHI